MTYWLWATNDIGRKLYYLDKYETAYAPTFTGEITCMVEPESGQIIDFII